MVTSLFGVAPKSDLELNALGTAATFMCHDGSWGIAALKSGEAVLRVSATPVQSSPVFWVIDARYWSKMGGNGCKDFSTLPGREFISAARRS